MHKALLLKSLMIIWCFPSYLWLGLLWGWEVHLTAGLFPCSCLREMCVPGLLGRGYRQDAFPSFLLQILLFIVLFKWLKKQINKLTKKTRSCFFLRPLLPPAPAPLPPLTTRASNRAMMVDTFYICTVQHWSHTLESTSHVWPSGVCNVMNATKELNNKS